MSGDIASPTFSASVTASPTAHAGVAEIDIYKPRWLREREAQMLPDAQKRYSQPVTELETGKGRKITAELVHAYLKAAGGAKGKPARPRAFNPTTGLWCPTLSKGRKSGAPDDYCAEKGVRVPLTFVELAAIVLLPRVKAVPVPDPTATPVELFVMVLLDKYTVPIPPRPPPTCTPGA